MRDDQVSNQEEVHVIIPYQVSEAIANGKKIYYNHLQRHWCFCFIVALLRLEEFGKKSLYDQLHGRKKHHIIKGYSKES